MNKELFEKSLQNLDKIYATLKASNKELNKMSKTAVPNLNKSFFNFEKTAQSTLKTFRQIWSVARQIGFQTMVAGGILGAKGIQAQKQSAEARILGLTTKERDALTLAGKRSDLGGDFFKNILSNIRDSISTMEGAGALTGGLGIDIREARKMNQIDLLVKVLARLKTSNLAQENIVQIAQELTGLTLSELKAIDLKQFKNDLKDSLKYTAGNTDQIKTIGVNFNKLLASIEKFTNLLVGAFVPDINKAIESITSWVQKLNDTLDFKGIRQSVKEAGSATWDAISETFRTFKDVGLSIFGNKEATQRLKDQKNSFLSNRLNNQTPKPLTNPDFKQYKEIYERRVMPIYQNSNVSAQKNLTQSTNQTAGKMDKLVIDVNVNGNGLAESQRFFRTLNYVGNEGN